jgi:2-C-methyl-D-erythritol 4-phosphate cytidylyltransferase
MPHTIALILAGGTGSRFGSARPKQFTLVAGRTVLEHSIAAFEQSEEIDEIGIVAHPDHLDEVRAILQQQPHPRVTQVVAGGKERQDSTLNGLRAFLREDGTLKNPVEREEKSTTSPPNSAVCAPAGLSSGKSPQATEKSPLLSAENSELSAETSQLFADNPQSATANRAHSDDNQQLSIDNPPAVRVLIHDAVRPGVSLSLIGRVCAALRSHAVANVVLPVVDTLIEVDADGRMHRVPNRALLRRVQTPQGFHAPVLFEAYRRALADPDFRATDDCSVVFRYCPEIDIALVPGEERNLKLTYPEDLTVLAHYLTQPLP